ncbi:MAG: protein kinase [Planctomycetes bacterium]|nr:protein kinase [Planctomycetota bacterium]
MLSLPCPHCQCQLLVTAEQAGKEAACPHCGQTLRYPPATTPSSMLPRTGTSFYTPPTESGTLSQGQTPPSVFERPSIAGYEILEEVGRGGMGVVYKARQTALKRVVALKMILAGAHASRDDLARFQREAEAAAQLQHPNVVQVYEIGEQQGLPFLALEFVDGGNLAHRLREACPSPREAAVLLETLARAVQAAHELRIIHRDLKPANVLLASGYSSPKITDFGLAKRLDLGDTSGKGYRTQSGAILGSPNYMAPEQAGGRNKQIGPACDVYALGAILYECLTGRPPFHAETPLDTVLAVLSEEPVPPRKLNPAVPRDLETVCLACLEKDPRCRYATARDLAEDLHRFLADEPIRARPATRVERAVRWLRRRKAAVGAVLGLLCLSLTLAFLPWTGSVAGPDLPAPGPETKVVLPADLDLVPRDALGFACVRVGDLLKSDLLEKFQRQLVKDNPALAAFLPLREKERRVESELGLNPLEIERVTLVVLSPSLGELGLVVLAHKKPIDQTKLLDKLLWGKSRTAKFLGRSYHASTQPNTLAVHFASDRVVVISGSEPLMKAFLERVPHPDTSGPLLGPLGRASRKAMVVAALNPPAPMIKEWAESLPERFAKLRPLLRFQSAVLSLDLEPNEKGPSGDAFGVDLQFAYPDADLARQAEEAARTSTGRGPNEFRKQLLAGAQTFLDGLIGLGSLTSPLLRPLERSLQDAEVRRDVRSLHLLLAWEVEVPKGPAVGDDLQRAAERVASANYLRQLGIAMINHNAVYNYLPPHAIFSKNGKPLLSWRVALLPFLPGNDMLYKQFKLDEPWDSPHNKKLLPLMPKVYAPVGKTTREPGLTYYQVFVGTGSVFDGQRKVSVEQVQRADGIQNTLLIVEAGEPVPWTKSEDLPFEPGKPLPKLGGLFPEGFHAVFCDYSALFIPKETPQDQVRALITWDGREKVNPRRLVP